MKQILTIFIWFNILLLPVGLQAETTQQQTEENYFDGDLPEIARTGETVISAKSSKHSVRVTIVAHKGQVKKTNVKKGTIQKPRCMYEYCIDIEVDGVTIFVPRSVFADLRDLNSGKVIIDGEKIVCILGGGDAAEATNVIIELDKNRIIQKREYLLCCDPRLLHEETIYHQVRW